MANSNLDYMDHINEHSPVEIANRVVKDMEKYMSDPNVIETALVAIWILGINPRNKEFLFKSQCAEAVLKAVTQYPDHEVLLCSAFCAIKNLKVNLYDFVIRKNGGILIISAMRKFQSNAKLQEHACSALKVIGASERTSEHLLEHKAALGILHAMRQHKFDERLQKSAIAAAWALSLTEKNKLLLWKSGVAHFIINAMQTHPKVERLQEYGSGILWTMEFPHCMMRLFSHEPVLEAMKRYKENQSIVSYGCGMVRKYASLQSNARELTKKQAAYVIVHALQRHPKQLKLQVAGCLAIWSLGIFEENKMDLISANDPSVKDFLIGLLTYYKKNTKVFSTAMGTVATLCTVKEIAIKFLDQGAAELMVHGLQLHAEDNLDCVKNGVHALKNFSFHWNQDQKEHLKKADIVSVLKTCVEKWKSRSELVEARGMQLLDLFQ